MGQWVLYVEWQTPVFTIIFVYVIFSLMWYTVVLCFCGICRGMETRATSLHLSLSPLWQRLLLLTAFSPSMRYIFSLPLLRELGGVSLPYLYEYHVYCSLFYCRLNLLLVNTRVPACSCQIVNRLKYFTCFTALTVKKFPQSNYYFP